MNPWANETSVMLSNTTASCLLGLVLKVMKLYPLSCSNHTAIHDVPVYVFMAHHFCTFSYLNLLFVQNCVISNIIEYYSCSFTQFFFNIPKTLIVLVVHGCPQFILSRICFPFFKSLLPSYSNGLHELHFLQHIKDSQIVAF